MKKYVLLIALIFPNFIFANSGFYGDCAAFVELNSTFYDIGGCSGSGHPAFDGTNLGVLSALTIDYAEQQTWENSGDDINDGNFNYRIWTGSASGPFITEGLNTVELMGGGNEKRSQMLTIDVMNGLSVNTTYTLEVYFHADYNYSSGSGSHYLTNGGPNYKITFTTAAILPVRLAKFEANEQTNGINLEWITTQEIQNDYFELESSSNNIEWNSIAVVKGAGNSTTQVSYEFLHKGAVSGLNYYRLTQYDHDGNVNRFRTIFVHLNYSIQGIEIFPNPFDQNIHIVHNNSDTYEIRAWDGKLIQIGSLKNDDEVIETNDLPKGIYQLMILKSNLIINRTKIIKI